VSIKVLILSEFKNYTVTGPLVDQIVGTNMRAQDNFGPGSPSTIFIFCRGYTADAEQRRRHHEIHRKMTVTFKVIMDQE